jgi:hypothetical protein
LLLLLLLLLALLCALTKLQSNKKWSLASGLSIARAVVPWTCARPRFLTNNKAHQPST